MFEECSACGIITLKQKVRSMECDAVGNVEHAGSYHGDPGGKVSVVNVDVANGPTFNQGGKVDSQRGVNQGPQASGKVGTFLAESFFDDICENAAMFCGQRQ